MGIASSDLVCILKLRADSIVPQRPRIVDIGAQQLSSELVRNQPLLDKAADAFSVTRRSFGTVPYRTNGEHELLPRTAPFARELWAWLGCPYAAIDIDETQHSIPLDLNFDEVPRKYRGAFDVVTNLGTTEHVANQMQAMKVIHDLCAIGGVMLHNLPTQGYTNHGLVNYNPKFFWMLSRSNRYEWLDADFQLSPPTPVSPDIVGELSAFRPKDTKRVRGYSTSDGYLLAVMRKTESIAYVPPLDVPTGAGVSNKTIRKRYHTVFR